MANKKQSTAELIGVSHFSRNGLMTKRYGEVVYFIVQPTNISVLSETSIAIKINHAGTSPLCGYAINPRN